VAGDGACGKTYAVMKYLRGHTSGIPYAPTVWASYTSDIKVDGYHCQVSWEDTTGQEDYDRLRPLFYPNCDVALLFFAIDSPDSLDNIQEKWAPEIYHFLSYIPKILVGCKTDLRYDPKTIEELANTSQKPVSRQQAEEVARLLGVGRRSSKFFQPQMQYMECSSFTGEGVKEIFEKAARLGIQYTSKKTETKPRRMSELFRRRFKVQPVTSIPEEDPGGFAIQTQYGESPIQ
jgi:Ras homolog gene family, member A